MIAYLRSGLRRTLCLSRLTFVSVHSMAQDTEEYSPDVPGATTGVGIMPQGKIAWETGVGLEWDKRNGEHAHTFTINTSLFRLGLTPQAEVRLQIDECITHTPEGNFGGIANAAIGTKIKVYEGGKILPKVAFMGTMLIPGGSNAHYLPKHLDFQAHLLFENELSSKFTLGYDLGGEWNGDTESPDLFFGANLTYQPSEKWSFFVESYNRYNSKRQDNWAKPGQDSHFNFMSEVGVDYKVSPRLHLNTFYDISFNEFSRYSNIGLGIAWLIN